MISHPDRLYMSPSVPKILPVPRRQTRCSRLLPLEMWAAIRQVVGLRPPAPVGTRLSVLFLLGKVHPLKRIFVFPLLSYIFLAAKRHGRANRKTERRNKKKKRNSGECIPFLSETQVREDKIKVYQEETETGSLLWKRTGNLLEFLPTSSPLSLSLWTRPLREM